MTFQPKWMKRGVIGIVVAGIVCLVIEPLIALIGVLGVGWLVKNGGYLAILILAVLTSFAIMLVLRKRSHHRLES